MKNNTYKEIGCPGIAQMFIINNPADRKRTVGGVSFYIQVSSQGSKYPNLVKKGMQTGETSTETPQNSALITVKAIGTRFRTFDPKLRAAKKSLFGVLLTLKQIICLSRRVGVRN